MTETDILDSRYSWTRLGITLAIAVLGNVGMWSIIVIMPAVQAEFGVARADASLPYTLTMIGFALGNLVIGRAVDRFGVTLALIGSAVIMAAGFGLAAVSQSILMLSAHAVHRRLRNRGGVRSADCGYLALVLPEARHCGGDRCERQLPVRGDMAAAFGGRSE
jgi:MFS family permease